MGLLANIRRGVTGVTIALGLIIVLQAATIWVLVGTGTWLEATLNDPYDTSDSDTASQLAELRSLVEETLGEAQAASSEAERAADSAAAAASNAVVFGGCR